MYGRETSLAMPQHTGVERTLQREQLATVHLQVPNLGNIWLHDAVKLNV